MSSRACGTIQSMPRIQRLNPALLLLVTLPAFAQAPLPTFETRWTAESWRMPNPGEQAMGLLGLQVNQIWESGAYAGFGGWGSLSGERGGFITMGIDGGWRIPMTKHLGVDLGLWVGGGGVGRASVGGGLMLRGHTGISWDTSHGTYILEWSRVRFPNGEIDSRQLALTAAFPFRMPVWQFQGAEPLPMPSLGHFRDLSISMTAQNYAPVRSVRNLDGIPDRAALALGGVEVRLRLGEQAFMVLDSAAAARGKADGYMDVLLGLGYGVDLADSGRLRATGKLVAGAAGGGHLDVGGGLAIKASVGLEALVGRAVLLSVSAGYVATPSASFQARVVQVQAGRHFTFAAPSGPAAPAEWAWSWSGWAFRPTFIRMTSAQRRGQAEAKPIDLAGLHFSHDLGAGFEMVGQGNFATAGKAGGFAQGLLGLAWCSPALMNSGPRLRLQGLVGEAGGGGVETSGGFVLQPSVGVEQDLGAGWSLQLLGGRSRAPQGKLNTTFLEGGLAWRFKVSARQ